MEWAHRRKAQLYEYDDGPAKHQIETAKKELREDCGNCKRSKKNKSHIS